MRMRAPLALLLAAALAAAPAVAEEEDYSKHLDAKAAAIVAVKFVLKIQDRERSINDTGIVVDPAGVVMLRSTAIKPSGFRGASVKASIANLRVIFPGDEKEYEAIAGAHDTRIGLSFVRIRDLAGKKISAVDVSVAGEPKLGDELFGVTRLEQGFDYAPYFGTARVAGQVTKPRAMWLVNGFVPLAHFLFFPDGKAAGVVISQSGVAEGDEFVPSRSFLLPMKTAITTIQQGIKESEKALAEDAARAKAEAEEGGAPTATPAPAPSPEPAPAPAPEGPPSNPPR